MTDFLDQLLSVGELTNTPSIPLISESVVASCFRENNGVITVKPEYVATSSSRGAGHIVLPPGAIIKPSELMVLRDSVIKDLANAGFVVGKKLLTDLNCKVKI